MDLFVVDTQANAELLNQDNKSKPISPKISRRTKLDASDVIKTNSKTKKSVNDFCKLMGWDSSLNKRRNNRLLFPFPEFNEKTGKVSDDLSRPNVAKEMENSVIKNIESEENLKKYVMSDSKLQAERKIERAKTKGANWYDLPATEVTDEIKRDLEILQMRSALDPKHFYKKNDLKVLPKYFQMGKVLDTPLDHYNDRGVKKNKKRTMVDELLADAEFQRFNKKKYGEIMESKQKTGYYKANKKMKKLKKKR